MFCMVKSIKNGNISSLIKKEEGKEKRSWVQDQIILQFILWNCFHVQITFFYVMTSVKYLKNKKSCLENAIFVSVTVPLFLVPVSMVTKKDKIQCIILQSYQKTGNHNATKRLSMLTLR